MTEDSRAVAPDGAQIAYQVRGEGPPLVLLAGQSNSHRWWDPVRGDFTGSHATITLDYRGTGDSDEPDEPYSTEGFAEDVVAVLDAMALSRVDLYGTSMGGRIAQWFAARHPERVRMLVLGCTSPGGPHAVERSQEVRRALIDPDPIAARRSLEELMFTPVWLAAHPGPHAVLGDPTMTPQARRRHLAASARHDAWDALPLITAPTLVLHGADDVFNPAANAALIASRIANARHQLIPHARHAYFEEFREIASPLVLDFLTG